MEIEAIVGRLLSGTAVTLYAGILGVMVALDAIKPLLHVSEVVSRIS